MKSIVKLRCVHGDRYFTHSKVYEMCGPDGSKYVTDDAGDVISVRRCDTFWEACIGLAMFEVVDDTLESIPQEPDTLSLQTITNWCTKADVDVTITNNGTFNVFDGTTEKQLEISPAENLIQLLQIMVSYKESLEDFGEWL